MMRIDGSRAVGGYAAVMTGIAAWAMLSGAATDSTTRFDTIDVRRINVREDDGTLRMIVAGRDNIGGIIVEGKEYPHPNRHEAGMIFFNDEGTENGGLVFSGRMKDGKPTNAGSLTFDRWRQDQTVQMFSEEEGKSRNAGFRVYDRPDAPMDFEKIVQARTIIDPKARDAAYAAAGGGFGPNRVSLGSMEDRSSQLNLRDANGKARLQLRVEADGAASIRFLDENGKVVRTTTPTS